jgi:hypothetical protein
MANRITTIFDMQVDSARSSLSALKTSVAEAHGFMGKLSAGASGVISTLKGFASSPAGVAAAGAAIAAAGSAIGQAAFEAANKFSSLGVEIGNFATATGLSTEEASRWVEVSGDMGLDATSVETAIGKMNKVLGTTPGVFKEAGIQTGSANKTFLNTIEHLRNMKDPEAQAALGAKLLGKGWQGMAELIGAGSAKLTDSLAKVSDVKVFTPAEVEKARKFRDTMADLKDQVEDVAIAFGQKLAPAMTSTARGLTTVMEKEIGMIDLTGKMFSTIAHPFGTEMDSDIQHLVDQMKNLQDAGLTETDRETRKLTASTGDLAGILDGQLVDATAAAKRATDEAKRAAEGYTRKIEEEQKALDSLYVSERSGVDSKYAYAKSTEEAMLKVDALNQTLADHKAKQEDVKSAIDNARDSVLKASEDYATLNGAALNSKDGIDRQITSLQNQAANLDPASPLRVFLTQYIADLKSIPLSIATELAINTKGGIAHGGVGVKAFASGTNDSGDGPFIAGEDGPELVTGRRHQQVFTASKTRRMLGGPPIVNNFYGITDPRELARHQARELGWQLRAS